MKFWCKKYMIYMHNFFTITIYDVKRWIVEGVLLPAIGSIGIIGNPLLGIYLNILRVQCKSGVSVTQFSWVVHHPFYAMWKFLQTADTYLSCFIRSLSKNSRRFEPFQSFSCSRGIRETQYMCKWNIWHWLHLPRGTQKLLL